MGRVSYTKLSDGTGADAEDINSRLDIIFNEFNGNIDGTNLANDITFNNLTAAESLTIAGATVLTGGGVLSTSARSTAVTGSDGGTITPVVTSSVYSITALGAAATIAAPTGTPTDGQGMLLRIKDNGTARALTWNAIYRVIGVVLPTTTVASKTYYIGMRYNTADSKWDVLSVAKEA